MRLHLTIQRHGLPVTRILWTTSPPSLFGPSPSSILPAASSAITSSRVPNAFCANGGYTVAQLLEDVNEVIPLETEPRLFEDESSGQWGLEDYVVEVGGSECLHFMEIEGLLRDGDEVLIRALQISDLRARRLSGRHQISTDGKHLIDGVPFGKPFLKRPTSSRPAIMIPPRKKRRTALATWSSGTYEEEDTEWAPTTGKELSILRPDSDAEDEYEDAYQDDYEDYHEPSEDADDTVIRHPVDKPTQSSESDGNVSEPETGDLTQELNDLKKDMEVSALPELGKPNYEEKTGRDYSLRSRSSFLPPAPRKSSLSRPNGKRSLEGDNSRRDSKTVRFNAEKGGNLAAKPEKAAVRAGSTSDESEYSMSSESDSSSSASDSSGSESESGGKRSSASDDSSSESESEEDSSSESESSASESEDEEVSKAASGQPLSNKINPPGKGSARTKKSNQRNKMRRKLSKLKELGYLDKEADFLALRKWEEEHDDSIYLSPGNTNTNDLEQEEFEARRQKLLRDLESGGIDVSVISEKENVPPSQDQEDTEDHPAEDEGQEHPADDANEATSEIAKRRTLDVASTRRLLFGSLGVRAPRSKEDEEATRKKLAGKAQTFVPRQVALEDATEKPQSEPQNEPEVNWQEKLTIGATECVYDDIYLIPPPFPFEQRWDPEAGEIIRQRKGWGKKRKRRQQLQVYDGEGGETGDDSFYEEGMQLNYDDVEPQDNANNEMEEVEKTANGAAGGTSSDLLPLPSDPSTLPSLAAGDMKPGLVFAFKQLDVSKATNWQPTVSDYRVAEVSEVFGDNIYGIRLAKTYRRQARDVEDGEDGPFQYSGFEMPGLDDDGEDDGFREVPFDDLIDPKLIRAPTATKPLGVNGDKNSPAAEEQNPSPPGIKAKNTSEDKDYGGTSVGEEACASEAFMKDPSPIQSPRFNGFELPTAGSEPGSMGSPVAKAGLDADNSHKTQNRQPLSPANDAPSTLNATYPPNAFPPDLPETGLSDQLQTISCPGTPNSFQNLMGHLLNPSPSSPFKRSSPASQSSGPSVVPNPFYEIDKAHEERRQHAGPKDRCLSSDDGASDRDSSPAPSSPLSQRTSKSERQESPSTQDPSQVSMVPDSIQPEEKNEDPDSQSSASQMPDEMTDFVDLTQSSPPVSPGGSDKDFAKTHRLPRGAGWVQKNIPATRRQTRQSSQSSAARPARLQGTPQRPMASRIPRRKKRRSRRA